MIIFSFYLYISSTLMFIFDKKIYVFKFKSLIFRISGLFQRFLLVLLFLNYSITLIVFLIPSLLL